MAIPKILCLSDHNKLWMYIYDTDSGNIKYVSIYDDKNENRIAFELDHSEMKHLADSILKYLEQN